MSSTILSTKVLSPRQKDMVLNAGIRLVQYDAIKITPVSFDADCTACDALIFTSQNAVNALIEQKTGNTALPSMAFCVGEKTKALANTLGIDVVFAENAQALATIIIEQHRHKSFLFLSGKQRLDILPNQLKKNKVRFTEIHVYDTIPTPNKINRSFDGILFFSPSAVESHYQLNEVGSSIAFCIGPTTEKAAKGYNEKTIIANKPSIENVLVQAIKQLRIHD
ncbi:MAG: uroporphyrinogen-III synthase [Allomuricauda sp.]|nr:MAG: uroporphyrinogen-III synthase [Allomuricauda sp.]